MTNAEDLAMCEINNGDRYARRCAAARMQPVSAAREFLHIAEEAAKEYSRVFDKTFSAADLLGAAGELCAYYTRHNAENDRLAAHEARGRNPGAVCSA